MEEIVYHNQHEQGTYNAQIINKVLNLYVLNNMLQLICTTLQLKSLKIPVELLWETFINFNVSNKRN